MHASGAGKAFLAQLSEEQNIEVMQRLGELTAYEYPVLLAPSRKENPQAGVEQLY